MLKDQPQGSVDGLLNALRWANNLQSWEEIRNYGRNKNFILISHVETSHFFQSSPVKEVFLSMS